MTSPPEALLTVRALLVLLTAGLVGVTAGLLSYLVAPNVPAAVLVGGGAFAVALPLLHTLLARA